MSALTPWMGWMFQGGFELRSNEPTHAIKPHEWGTHCQELNFMCGPPAVKLELVEHLMYDHHSIAFMMKLFPSVCRVVDKSRGRLPDP